MEGFHVLPMDDLVIPLYSFTMSAAHPEVFHIPVEGPSLPDLFETIKKTLTPLWIITLNPEMLVAAHRDASYASVLRQADIRTVDGFGLWLALRLHGEHVHRVAGVPLAENLLEMAESFGWKVGCFGGHPGTGASLEKVLKQEHPELRLHIEEAGYVQEDGILDERSENALHRMQLFAPDVLLVALGGGTKQERWIARYMGDIPCLRVVVGVGGTFDYWTGRIPRAPRFFQRIGLEWLWRLFQEPKRIGRIFTAVIIFPYLYIKSVFAEKQA